MARIIEARTGQRVYVEVLETIRRRGRKRDSRNGPVLEVEDLTIVLDTPQNALPTGVGRNVSRKIAAVETLQLIGGWSNPAWTLEHAPSLRPYVEDDGFFWGNYGLRIGDQFAHALQKLRDDPNTRQAVVTLWDPARDNQPNKRDYPCTVGIGFSVNVDRGELNARVTMRSNDAWLGLPYDMFQFAQLQLTACNLLDYLPGRYTHTAWSMHLYTEHVPLSYGVVEHPDPNQAPQPSGFGWPGQTFRHVQRATQAIANDDTSVDLYSDDERWYHDALHG